MTVGRQASIDAGWSLSRTRYGAGMTGNLLLAIDSNLLPVSIVHSVSLCYYVVPMCTPIWKKGNRGDFLINVYSIMRPSLIDVSTKVF
jgi:hypothetical protein